MDEHSGGALSVRALTEQIQRSLDESHRRNAVTLGGSRNALPKVPIRSAPNPPAIPPHARTRDSLVSNGERTCKPPIAPKPQGLRTVPKSPVPAVPCPEIRIERPSVNEDGSEVVETPRRESSTRGENLTSETLLERDSGFKEFEWEIESSSSKTFHTGKNCSDASVGVSRRVSAVSFTSCTSASGSQVAEPAVEAREEMDLGELDSDSESEEDQSHRGVQRMSWTAAAGERLQRVQDRRPSALPSSCDSISSLMHDKIMEELYKQNIIRASRRKPLSAEEIPSDVGRMRDDRKTRSPLLSANSTVSDDGSISMPSQRSSTSTVTSGSAAENENSEGVRDYDTGDANQDKRLKRLHYAALEFVTVQEKFVKYLDDMGNVYPGYLHEYGKKIGRDVVPVPNNGASVVQRLQSYMLQMLPFHREMLTSFREKLTNWDSSHPTMAAAVSSLAPYLKVCKPFILAKTRLSEELTELLSHTDFRNATTSFEEKVFGRGIGAVTQQLDQVHQNFLRYKILMISYSNYLEESTAEMSRAKSTISQLEKIAQDVNRDLDMPSGDELFRLFERFEGHFNVFKPACRLLKQGPVEKQTRKEPQPRYLVLFSEVLWLCREGMGGAFDMDRSYDIPVDTVHTEVVAHEDFDKLLRIKSAKRSFALLFKTRTERDSWNQSIRNAAENRRQNVRSLVRYRRASVAPSLPVDRSHGWAPEPASDNADSLLEETDPEEHRSHDEHDMDPERVQAAWIPDDSATRCLMSGCGTVFGVFNRRHHCRDCGWLICSSCVGRAPLAKQQFQSNNVCPECYDRIERQYLKGTLFPEPMLVRSSENGDEIIRIALDTVGKSGRRKTESVTPQSLFRPPQNSRLKRLDVESRMQEIDGLVFGKVFVRGGGGKEVMKFAQLTNKMVLKLYAAVYDDQPESQHVIYGYQLKETDALDGSGTLFELRHRNQFKTDRGEHVVAFRVEKDSSAKKWSCALREGLGLPPEE